MAGFGGSVKLTGESEYRKALQQITQNLKEVSSQMKVVASSYDKNDKSVGALTAKQDALNAKLTEQKNRLTVLQSQYSAMASKYNENANAHNKLVGQYNKEKAELEKIGQELGTSSKEYQDQKAKVDDLAQAVSKSSKNQEANAKAMSEMRIQMNNAQADINKTTKEIDNLGKESEDTGKQIEKAGDGFTVFKGIVADLGSKAIQTAISGLKKLGGMVINVGKQALESYADYEQLVGGVETLFKDSAEIVEDYANKAYKTAGLSANQYMETVTSFSASLLQSLGQDTKKSAEYADMAIIDMSDNANKMGTSMEMIQNAYQGFAKQNYTMLDNLKLGYGGTKTEMERLIKDANKVKEANGEMANLSISSFADMVEAIHIIQTEMGITGTTAKEADSTIQGSLNSMKGAWHNLLVGIADDNQDFGKLVDNFIDSVITAGDNIIPRVKKIAEGIKKLVNNLVTEVFPKLKKQVPELKPLIEVFEWFIKNKSLVVNAVKLMVGAFVATKIASFAKTVGNVTKGFYDFAKEANLATGALKLNTTATATNTAVQATATTATNGLKTAVNMLNLAWKTNPIGVVIAGVTTAIGLFSALKGKIDEAREAQNEQKKAMEESAQKTKEVAEAYDELRQTQQKAIDAGMTEMNHYESLYDELLRIVDANGRVKEGYEERASFITSQLSEALGIEIKNVDGVIQGYDKLKDTIDEVMEKKKAQVILDSQETLYTEAINNQAEATRKLADLKQQVNDKTAEQQKWQDQLNDIYDEYNRLMEQSPGYAQSFLDSKESQINLINRTITGIEKEKNAIQTNYDEQKNIVEKYAYDISQYETNMALAHAGKYDEMTQVNWNYVQQYEATGDAQKAQLEDNIRNEESYIAVLKDLKEQSGSDMYDQQIKDHEKMLKENQDSLDKYLKQTTSTLDTAEVVWSDGLDSQLSEILGAKIEFKDAGNGQVQAYINGVKTGAPKSKEEMAKLADDAVKEIKNRKGDATDAGENFAIGVGNGVENKKSWVFSKISSFGKNLLAKFKNSLEEKSPSKATKEMGEYLLEGLGLGIDKKENTVMKQVTDLGKNLIRGINQGLNSEAISTNLSSQIQSAIPTDINTTANLAGINSTSNYQYNNMVEAFQEALASMKIELDDEEAGKFVRRTVEDAIYT